MGRVYRTRAFPGAGREGDGVVQPGRTPTAGCVDRRCRIAKAPCARSGLPSLRRGRQWSGDLSRARVNGISAIP